MTEFHYFILKDSDLRFIPYHIINNNVMYYYSGSNFTLISYQSDAGVIGDYNIFSYD